MFTCVIARLNIVSRHSANIIIRLWNSQVFAHGHAGGVAFYQPTPVSAEHNISAHLLMNCAIECDR